MMDKNDMEWYHLINMKRKGNRRQRLLKGQRMSVNWIGISPNHINTCRYHSHTDWEIVLNMSGKGKAFIDGKYYDFYPGAIMCVPPYTLHSKSADDNFNDIFMHIDRFLLPYQNEVMIFSDDEEKIIETLLHMVLRIFHKKEKNYLTILSSLDSTIQQILLSWCNTKKKNEGVELLKNEIIKNFTNPEFRISETANVTPYSKDHVRRRFKSDTGMNPIAYLINLRLEYAISLLRQKEITGHSISEIAYLSGFYDPHYFSRLFKQKKGISPEQYALINAKKLDKQSFFVEDERSAIENLSRQNPIS